MYNRVSWTPSIRFLKSEASLALVHHELRRRCRAAIARTSAIPGFCTALSLHVVVVVPLEIQTSQLSSQHPGEMKSKARFSHKVVTKQEPERHAKRLHPDKQAL
jgi:hypothetical protein